MHTVPADTRPKKMWRWIFACVALAGLLLCIVLGLPLSLVGGLLWQMKSNLDRAESASNALELYFAYNEKYPISLSAIVTEDGLASVPRPIVLFGGGWRYYLQAGEPNLGADFAYGTLSLYYTPQSWQVLETGKSLGDIGGYIAVAKLIVRDSQEFRTINGRFPLDIVELEAVRGHTYSYGDLSRTHQIDYSIQPSEFGGDVLHLSVTDTITNKVVVRYTSGYWSVGD